MRVTTRMFFDRFLSGFQSNMEAILKTQEQISSGKRVNRPSDDPAALSKITAYKTQISRIVEYKRSITTANSMVGSLDKALLSLTDTLNRARELGLEGADASATGSDRLLIAKEISALFEHAIDIANTKVGDRYIFSGYKSDTAPIDKNTGEFVGDSNSITLNISANTEIKLNVSASDLFSFKRVNPSDSANLVLPSYNVDKTGTYASTDEIYEDADPNGALHTTQFIVTGANNKIAGGTNGDATPDFTATLTAGTYTADEMATEIKRALEAADGTGYSVSYNSTTKKFVITNNRGAARDLLWADATTTAESLLGFAAVNTLAIANGSSDTSDNVTTFTSSTATFSTSGGTLTIKVGDDDATAVDVSISALATLADVRNAINSADAGVKAEIVNVSATSIADYRIVIASDPAGRQEELRVTATSDDAAGTGLHALVYMADNDTITVSSSNNQIRIWEDINNDTIQDAGEVATATISTGTYTADQLAGAVKAALEGTTASTNTYTVAYDSTNKKFKIISDNGNANDLALLWSDSNTTAATVLGFDATDTTGITDNDYDTSDNALSYGVQNQTLGTDIANYNYITNPSNDNYYSFNNNYLNETNILRALNFLKVSLENNDAGRVEKAIDYLTKTSDRLFQIQADVGSRMSKLETEETYQVDREFEITTYMSNEQDTDIAKAITEMTQRETALEGLRTLSSDVLRTSLFDFIR
ncbi:MAG TPA: flagellar hook-associated protein 3 [Nitrospiraceae bacterium]|nr:MAG: flagellar hook-associated protein 3 [Nitrospirae bacterium GWA2_46_11]OGW22959.1 MAG: flagellar hook-associated protein 3 [Nitrospirae bacterium GWB2_47_37]HAK89959.1 flagellar hook-associated protein 3 [Nitrospiraceae bacterium]HCZ11104.1 flagellar hook-associated protein 3 [Nitrospiraceae bacterium]